MRASPVKLLKTAQRLSSGHDESPGYVLHSDGAALCEEVSLLAKSNKEIFKTPKAVRLAKTASVSTYSPLTSSPADVVTEVLFAAARYRYKS